MRRLIRENALSATMAGVATGVVAWLGLYSYGWTDYENEVQPAFNALVHGHVERFLQIAPSYGGSLIERAPFALLPGVWGGGALAVYRAVAVPCLLGAALLGVWTVAHMRSTARTTRLARAVALALFVANPLTVRALELGHPEELLGAALCVAAALAAIRGRAVFAGVALGLAIANKEWALAAVGPVLVGLPASASPRLGALADHRRLRELAAACARPAACLASAAATAAAVLAPLVLVPGGRFVSNAHSAASGGALFEPWQLGWFLGHPVHSHGASGASARHVAPAWVYQASHPSIVLASVVLTAILLLVRWRSPRGHTRATDALVLLALALLARCMLDTWDNLYYALPCVFALTAWEASERLRAPALALSVTVLLWASFEWTAGASGNTIAAIYLAFALPLAALLAVRLYAPAFAERITSRLARALPAWAIESRAYGLAGTRLPAPPA